MGMEMFCEIMCAIILPPLGVFFRHGCGCEFLICLLLTLLGYVPGMIYAVYIIVAHSKSSGDEGQQYRSLA